MTDEVTVTQQRDDTLTAAMDNVLAMRLGRVARETGRRTFGDLIDYGLALNSELNKAGFALVKTSDDHLFIGQHPRHRTTTAVPNGVVEAAGSAFECLTYIHETSDDTATARAAKAEADKLDKALQQSAPAALTAAKQDSDAVGLLREAEVKAKAAYRAETSNGPIHCNRYPSWDELSEEDRRARIDTHLSGETA